MLRILSIRGFTPYLAVAFLNACTDLGHKIIIQNTIFKFYSGTEQVVLTALVNACIVLPFVLFFTPTGFLADKFPKERVIRVAAFCAVPLTIVITLAYYMGWFELAFAMTLLMGIQSAFYSPAKYGYIRELVGKENIAGANAFVQAITIIAILGGTVLFSALFEGYVTTESATLVALIRSVAPLGWILVVCSVVEFALTLRLPHKRDTDTQLHFDIRQYVRLEYLRRNLRGVRASQVIWLSIIGMAVFWGVNQVVLAAFPAYLKETLQVQNTLISNGLMGIGGIGIILGSFIAGKASEHHIETGIIPLGALGMTVALFTLPTLHSLWGIGVLFLLYGVMGGLFLIPLNALVQFNARNDEAGTILAANNFMQNLLMSLFLVITAFCTSILSIPSVWLLHAMAAVTCVGSVIALSRLPQAFVRYVVMILSAQRYTLRVLGIDNIPSSGGVLLLGNHASWFDWAILQIACPRPIRYVMLRSIYELPILKGVLQAFGVIPIAPGKDVEQSLTQIREALRNGDVVAMFPEGRISRNGQLAPFKRGFERVLEGLKAEKPIHIVPFYLRGLWGTAFSYAARRYRQSSVHHGKRSITVVFGERMPIESTASLVKQRVTLLSIRAWHDYAETLEPLHEAFLKTARRFPLHTALVNALTRQRMTFIGAAARVLSLSRVLKRTFVTQAQYATQTRIGVLLPTDAEGVITVLALMMCRKTVALIDYSSSAEDVTRSIELSNVKVIVTSRVFLELLMKHFPALARYLPTMHLVYTEDMQQAMKVSVLRSVWLWIAPLWLLKLQYSISWVFQRFSHAQVEEPAVMLCTGMGETLRVVAYTHRHMMLSIRQSAEVLNPQETDTVLAVVPLCTAFGFVVSVMMPLICGVPVVCAENTDIRTVGKSAAWHDASLLFAEPWRIRVLVSSDQVHPLMFASLRLVVTGTTGEGDDGEERTYHAFKQKFGVNVYEGFSVPSVTPVVTVNVPDAITPGEWSVQIGTKLGTVGMPLPGCAVMILDERTGNEKSRGEIGRISIGSPYSALQNRENGYWSLTDIRGSVDDDGFLTIAGKSTNNLS
ncbi:MAG: MFS transporter [Bacteroidota bacterium]|nr:MFS transporter [Candidatus Kapabacteria bacterium]MDW8219971.1 MFS transporter [Bacteroidota bacterium]